MYWFMEWSCEYVHLYPKSGFHDVKMLPVLLPFGIIHESFRQQPDMKEDFTNLVPSQFFDTLFSLVSNV